MKNKCCLMLVLGLLAAACAKPHSHERFILGDGPYTFTVDMSDSTVVYDFDLYTRVDSRKAPEAIALEMCWKSPSDSVFRETVYLSGVYAPYRSNTVPARYGIWTLTVNAPSRPEGFRGLGLVVREKKTELWDTEN